MKQHYDEQSMLLARDMYVNGVTITSITELTGVSTEIIYRAVHYDSKVENFQRVFKTRGVPIKDVEVEEEIIRLCNLNKHLPRAKRRNLRQMYKLVTDKFSDRNISFVGFCGRVRRTKEKKLRKSVTDPKPLLYLTHYPGEMQVDYGFCQFIENGKKFRGAFLVCAFAYSNVVYVQVSKHKKTEDLLLGLQNIFRYIGFIPKILIFDNDPAIVNLQRPDPTIPYNVYRELVPRMKEFQDFYGFEVRLCNPRIPREKGVVERMVAFARKSMFVPIPEFDNIDDFNKTLFKMCNVILNDRKHYLKKKHKMELLRIEKHACKPFPSVEFEIKQKKRRQPRS